MYVLGFYQFPIQKVPQGTTLGPIFFSTFISGWLYFRDELMNTYRGIYRNGNIFNDDISKLSMMVHCFENKRAM